MSFNQEEVLNQIRGTVAQRRQAIRSIASSEKLRQDMVAYVVKNSGSRDDGVMLFHDSIVAFVKKVFTQSDFELTGTVESYIYGIGRYKWLTILAKKERDPTHYASRIDEALEKINSNLTGDSTLGLEHRDRDKIILSILADLKVNCKKVLMYWAGGYKMKEIAALLDYKNEGTVRKKKYECLKELILWLEDHPEIKEELKP